MEIRWNLATLGELHRGEGCLFGGGQQPRIILRKKMNVLLHFEFLLAPVLHRTNHSFPHLSSKQHLEIVAPHISPPVALSARALSAHSESSSPSINSAANSPSPPLSLGGQSGDMNPPPGSMAAQIAERLMGNDNKDSMTSTSNRKASGGIGHRRPHSDAASSASSFRSRSPIAMGGRGVQQVLDFDATGTGNSAALSHSNVSAFSRTTSGMSGGNSISAMSQSVASGDFSNGGSRNHSLPIATSFPALPLPNPYRSASPNHGSSTTALGSGNGNVTHGLGLGTPSTSILNLPLDLDGGRPAVSSLSIDGAIISGNEVASASASLGGLADALAHSDDVPSTASPYVGKRTSNFSPEIPSSPTNPSVQQGHLKSLSSSSMGLLNPDEEPNAENSGTIKASDPKTKHRLSFFSYANLINQDEPELMGFDEAVKSSSQADELQHGRKISTSKLPGSVPDVGFGYGYAVAGSGDTTISGGLASVGMGRSASTSENQTSNFGGVMRESKSGTSTPLRGRKSQPVHGVQHQSLNEKLQALKEPL